MDNQLSQEEFQNFLRKRIKENFDAAEFNGPAQKAAKQDINASGDKFVPLGKSAYEKDLNPKKFTDSLKEDDEDEDLGIYTDFDTDEFQGAAMKAAMRDIENSGDKFVPLGKSKYEKNLDTREFTKDLERQKLNLPSDKKDLAQLKGSLDRRNKHEKQFGIGTLNEGKLSKTDPLFSALSNAGLNPEVMPWGTIDFDIFSMHGETTLSFHSILETSNEGKRKLYTANSIFRSHMGEGEPDIDKNIFIGSLEDAIKFAVTENNNAQALLDTIPKHVSTPAEPHVGPRVVGKMDLPLDNKKRFKEEISENLEKPKDAEGNDISTRMRVEDIVTGAVGRVVRFGVDNNGKQTVHIDWIAHFGAPIPKSITYPNRIIVKDAGRIQEDEIEEGMGQSYTIGKGQNAKPSNYPEALERQKMKEAYDYAGSEIEYHEKQNLADDQELYLVIDNDFNRAHYKDLIGKTFEDVPAHAQVKVIKKSN